MQRATATLAFILTAGSLLTPAALAQSVPADTLRVAAEWEPAIGAQIRWPLGVPIAVAREIAEDDLLFVYVPASQQAAANTAFVNAGVNMANVRYVNAPTDNIWTRDFGPSMSYSPLGQAAIADHLFTGYSVSGFSCATQSWMDTSGWSNDDAAPGVLAQVLGVPRVIVGAYLVGGNFLVDGTGRAFYTCQLYRENQQRGLSQSIVDSEMSLRKGISQRIVLPNFETSGIQHIDCAIKLIDEETILVKRTPANHPSFAATNNLAAILASTPAPSGRNYRVIRLDCPYYSGSSITNYTNSLILNRKVLMPAWNIPGDAVAAQTFRDAMPGYEVVLFPWNQWFSNDALHCRVRAVWDPQMLHVRVNRLPDSVSAQAEYPITVNVRSYGGPSVISSSLRWRAINAQSPQPWNTAPLLPGASPHQFTSIIAGQPAGTRIEYYLTATNSLGETQTMPVTAPAWTYAFTITGSAPCDDIDFNNNGVFPEDQDVLDFFSVLAGGTPATCDATRGCNDIDFNNNAVFPEDQDVLDFFTVLAGGAC